MHLVEQVLHGAVAPGMALLGQKHLNVPTAEIIQANRQCIDTDTLNRARLPLERILCEQGPPSDQGPTRDVRIGLKDLLHASGGVLRGLPVVVSIPNDHPGMFLGLLTNTGHALLQIGRVLVTCQNGDGSLASQNSGQFGHHLFTAQAIVHAIAHQALRGRRIRIEGHHRHPIGHRLVDGVGHLVGITATDGDAVGTGQHQLFNGLGLLLGVFLIGCPPIDANLHPVSGPQLARGILGTDPRYLEHGISLRLSDKAEAVGLRSLSQGPR